MIFRLACVGKASGPLQGAIAEYERRAARYWPLECVDVRAEPARGRTVDEVRRLEAVRLKSRATGFIVALDETGRSMDTAAFARWMTERRDRAEDVTFLLGGAFGLDASLRSLARLVLSVAPWTLPHDLARLVLAEQLYRAGTVARGEPYHKDG